MDIIEKYKLLRPNISDGDLILFRGTGVIAKIIQWCDKSYWNHIGIVLEKERKSLTANKKPSSASFENNNLELVADPSRVVR